MQNTIAAAVSEYTIISGEVLEINDSSLTLLLDIGEAPNGEAPDGQLPEKPDGDASNGQPPEMPNGDASNGQPPEMPDGEYSDESYSSTGDDENALRIDGAAVTLSDVTVSKSAGSSSNPENGDFYGVNAAILATNGATVDIKDSDISSSAQNGNGVFSYGDCTVTSLTNNGTIDFNGYTITLADGSVLK